MASVTGTESEDPIEKAQLECTIVAQAKVARICCSINRNHGSKEGRIGNRNCMLCATRIRTTHRSDFATAPGLCADPLCCIEPIIDIVAHECPSTLGAISATSILRDDDIALLHEWH